jgi:hypothetical protein
MRTEGNIMDIKDIKLQIGFYGDNDDKIGPSVFIEGKYVEGKLMCLKIGQPIPEGAKQMDIDIIG